MELPLLDLEPPRDSASHGHMPLPTYLQVEPVGQCNLRCQMCPIQFREDGPPHGPPAFMDFDVFTRLVDQFHLLERLHLQGLGEPMMHPRFFDMIEYASRRGVTVSTNTNLTYLTHDRAERCITSGLKELHASLDGATAATFERIRVRAKFDQVWANLRGLVAAKRQLGNDTLKIRLVAVAMRMNLHELPELVRLAHGIGIDSIFVQHLCHDFGEASLPEKYWPMRQFVNEQTLLGEDTAKVERSFSQARELARELGLDLRLPHVEPVLHPAGTPGRERCDWPWRGAYVSYDGRAMPCCMVATPDRVNFGSMVRHGAEAIWNGHEYHAFRDQLSSDSPPAVCQSCSVYSRTF